MKEQPSDSNEETKIIPKEKTPSGEHNKYLSVFKLQFVLMTWPEFFFFILGIVGCMGIPVDIATTNYYVSLHNNTMPPLMGQPAEILAATGKLVATSAWLGALTFVFGLMLILFWNHHGKTMADRYKKQYFNLLMQKDQQWFDMKKPLEIANKALLELDAIELGVNLLFIFF